jgi:hypothetical protein
MALFVLLAYTGFAHKFPDAVWSWPFRALPNGGVRAGNDSSHLRVDVRRVLRGARGTLAGTKRGRASVAVAMVCVGRLEGCDRPVGVQSRTAQTPPPHRRWNYAEKAEYWALVWGSMVMIVTGAMLVFTETVLRLCRRSGTTWPR